MIELAGGYEEAVLESSGLSSCWKAVDSAPVPQELLQLLGPICDRFSGFITALIFPVSSSLGGGIKDVYKMGHLNEID